MGLEELRAKIDAFDEQIVGLLNQRFTVVKQIGALKRKQTLDAFVPERESALLKRLSALNQGPMKNDTLRAIYREIHSGALALEKPLTVAFLGQE